MSDSASPLLGVSACIVGQTGILLIKRGKPPFSRLWSLPGGGVRFGENLQAAARREVAEETGLVVEDLTFITFHEVIEADSHAVIAVFADRVIDDAAPNAADDALAADFLSLIDIRQAESNGQTTPGLTTVIQRCLANLPAA